MNLQPRDPLVAALSAVFSPSVIDGIFYFFEKCDEYEKKQRYDDNRKRFLEQALRLFEQGELTKEQLKVVIDLLPETRTIQTATVQQPNVEELLKRVLDQ